MEEKLLQYRAAKKRNELFPRFPHSRLKKYLCSALEIARESGFENGAERKTSSLTPAYMKICAFIIWLICLGISFYVEFALVYCILSTLVFMYMNTSTNPKGEGYVSAYSVFNENCEEIKGTFNASDFDEQIRRGGF